MRVPLSAVLGASAMWWASAPLGQPVPEQLSRERDYPWASRMEDHCAWQGSLLLCAPPGRGVDRVYRAHEDPVLGGERRWLRSAGLEWRSGWVIPQDAPRGSVAYRWGQHAAPFAGWDVLEPAPPVRVSSVRGPRAVHVEGLDRYGPAAPAVVEALSRCGSVALSRLPLVVLYDDGGEARMVRLQGFPPDDVDLDCVVAAVGGPARPAGVERHLELMVSLEG